MKLNKQTKDKYREQIKEKLKEVPEGKRIHLDRELLEQLLFDALYATDNSIILKMPVWSGEFLSKIDLSEVSFEDVSWYINNADRFNGIFIETYYEDLSEKMGKQFEIIDKYIGKHVNDETINVVYSNTNADIDLKKSWEYKMVGQICICNCNFSGTNLSKNKASIYDVSHSDLSYTGIQILPEKKYISYTNLEGVDLSRFEIDYKNMAYNSTFNNCNLKNTGIRIINFSKEIIQDHNGVVYEQLKEKLKNGEFAGCYINGVLIKSKEERKQIADEMRIKYQQFEEEILKDTFFDIDNQIRGMKK